MVVFVAVAASVIVAVHVHGNATVSVIERFTEAAQDRNNRRYRSWPARLHPCGHSARVTRSVMESASHLDVMKVGGLIDDEQYDHGIGLLERVVAMLTSLIDP